MTWKPAPGQVTLLEIDDRMDCLTGIVLDDDGRHLVVDLGASPDPPHAACGVVASFFGPDALYRVTATAVPHPGQQGVLDMTVSGVERVQRRTAPRARIALAVLLSAFDTPGQPPVTLPATTVDVGPGGCRVRTSRPFPSGCDPTVTVQLPDGSHAVALGAALQVRRIDDEWEYRLVFVSIADEDAQRLADLVLAVPA